MRGAALLAAAAVCVVCVVCVGVVADECADLELEVRLAPQRQARWDNAAHNVTLRWDSAPGRAAAALLRVLLRYWRGYRHLRLASVEVDYCNLTYKHEAAVGVWTSSSSSSACVSVNWYPLVEQGVAAVRLRLHVRLASAVNASSRCAPSALRSWPFYTDEYNLCNCSFGGIDSNDSVLYSVSSEVAIKFEERAKAASLLVKVELVDRRRLMDLIEADDRSFLFIDYDIWQDYPLVYDVQPPPCAPSQCSDLGELDATTGENYARYELWTYAPDIIQVLKRVKPESKYLRELLQLEATYPNRSLEETTCGWARNHSEEITRWANAVVSDPPVYIIIAVSCNRLPDIEYDDFKAIHYIVTDEFKALARNYGLNIDLVWHVIDCYNETQFSDLIVDKSKQTSWYKTLGVVARGEGAMAVACGNNSMYLSQYQQLPMVLYDAAPACAEGRWAVWAGAGTAQQLAVALRRLLADCGWRRLALLSDATRLSRDLAHALDPSGDLLLERASLALKTTDRTLSDLKARNARIFVVNAGWKEAAAVLTAAHRLGMTAARGYAWIVREWTGRSPEEREAQRGMRLLTVCLWSRSETDVSPSWNDTYRRRLVRALGEGAGVTWSLRAAPYADAIRSLGSAFVAFFASNLQYRYDIHSDDAVRSFTKSLNENSIKGFSAENLRYNATENQTIYVDEWMSDKRTRLTEWRVRNGVAHDVPGASRGAYPPPNLTTDDGYSSCIARYGDPFDPVCLDYIWISALVLLPLLSLGIWAVRERYRKLAARRREELELARHGSNVTKLLSLMVNRDELEIREELGFGKSGRVNLAILRRAGRPRAVAAKALRDEAALTEESEFLREACTLASLEHDHVVRLVGVCIVGGPTLVLMEHAFFGDLLRYLRARRHLAEGAGSGEGAEGAEAEADAPDPEAAHVSAEALTRLAREAASALGYLALRGVVHCDVRAANCLVDARRSLKLADFGMARQTSAAVADAGLAEYACRRRAMFPVLWMAPESLTRGVFSAATDVWSLGVLVFELVTLGARPYGEWSPLRVLHFVHDGGRPELPLDASPQTRGLALACWRRAGDERPSAADVVAYLAERPRALSPALQPTRTAGAAPAHKLPLDRTDVDADSGFGETPSPGPEGGAHDRDPPNFDLYGRAVRHRPAPDILHHIAPAPHRPLSQ